MTSRAELAEVVYGVLAQADDNGAGPISRADYYPKLHGEQTLSVYESELRDWGVVVGMAFAMARAGDPFAPLSSASEHALEAAGIAWKRWAGVFEERPEVLRATDCYGNPPAVAGAAA